MRALRLLKHVIMLAGLGFLIGGIYYVVETREFLARADSAEGIILYVELVHGSDPSSRASHRPTVRFKARDGRSIQFAGSPTGFSSVYQAGERVAVWYNPADPKDAKVGGWFGLWAGPAFAIAIGGLISLVFAAIYGFKAYAAGKGVYLRYCGVPVRTTFVAARPNPTTYINDVHPYNVVSRWRNPRTGKTHEFESENVWSDLSQYVPDREITVYIKRDDPGTYHMDMSFLSAKKPPALEDPFATESGAHSAGKPEIPLGAAVRENWIYLIGTALWGPYIFLLEPRYEFPAIFNALLFFVMLGLAFVPVIRGKAPMTFWVIAVGIWTAGGAVALVWQTTAG